MRLLLDECVDHRLRHAFVGHECISAGYARLAGLKNGALLNAAERAGFEVLITADQEVGYQQNFQHRKLSVLILAARTNRLPDLLVLAPQALFALESITPGQVLVVNAESPGV